MLFYNFKIIIIFVEKDDRTPSVNSDGKVKSEYYSDNSASLPGIMGTPGPVGFEPGMFKKEEEHKQKSDSINKVNYYKYKYIYITYIFTFIYIIYFVE